MFDEPCHPTFPLEPSKRVRGSSNRTNGQHRPETKSQELPEILIRPEQETGLPPTEKPE